MLFPGISLAVIDYTRITSVREYSKSLRLLFRLIEISHYGVLNYFTGHVTYVTLRILSNVQDKVTNTTCLYLFACWHSPFTSFYSGSFAEEVTQNINYH